MTPLAQLYADEGKSLTRYLARHTDWQTGQDLCNEAFASFADPNRFFTPSRDLLWAKAMQLLVNEQSRRKTRQQDYPLDPDVRQDGREGTAGSFSSDEDNELAEKFNEALRSLDQDMREAFTLVHVRGLTTREGAELLDQHYATISRRAELARQLIKEAIS